MCNKQDYIDKLIEKRLFSEFFALECKTEKNEDKRFNLTVILIKEISQQSNSIINEIYEPIIGKYLYEGLTQNNPKHIQNTIFSISNLVLSSAKICDHIYSTGVTEQLEKLLFFETYDNLQADILLCLNNFLQNRVQSVCRHMIINCNLYIKIAKFLTSQNKIVIYNTLALYEDIIEITEELSQSYDNPVISYMYKESIVEVIGFLGKSSDKDIAEKAQAIVDIYFGTLDP